MLDFRYAQVRFKTGFFALTF